MLTYLWLVLALAQPPKIATAAQLVRAMQERYVGKWPTTFTFTQLNSHYAADTVQSRSLWYEAIRYPGDFRIDFGPPTEGNAVLFARDSVFRFQEGNQKSAQFQRNTLTLLTGGLHHLPYDTVLARLRAVKFDLALFREDVWQGRPAYVVGAMKNDYQSEQFWVDRQHLYLLRTVTMLPGGHLQEARFSKHVRAAGGWCETEVLFLLDGQRRQLENYQQVRANAALPEGLFAAGQFGKVHWMNAAQQVAAQRASRALNQPATPAKPPTK